MPQSIQSSPWIATGIEELRAGLAAQQQIEQYIANATAAASKGSSIALKNDYAESRKLFTQADGFVAQAEQLAKAYSCLADRVNKYKDGYNRLKESVNNNSGGQGAAPSDSGSPTDVIPGALGSTKGKNLQPMNCRAPLVQENPRLTIYPALFVRGQTSRTHEVKLPLGLVQVARSQAPGSGNKRRRQSARPNGRPQVTGTRRNPVKATPLERHPSAARSSRSLGRHPTAGAVCTAGHSVRTCSGTGDLKFTKGPRSGAKPLSSTVRGSRR